MRYLFHILQMVTIIFPSIRKICNTKSITDIKIQKGVFDINISSNVRLEPGDFTVTNNGVTQKITSASIKILEKSI